MILSLITFFLIIYFYYVKKKVYAIVLLLILANNMVDYVDFSQSLGDFTFQLKDLALVALMIIIIKKININKFLTKIKSQNIYFFAFIIFLILDVLYSFFFLNMGSFDIFSSIRTWFFLLIILIYDDLSENEIHKIFILLVLITIINCVTFYLQIWGINLYALDYTKEDSAVLRYTNLSPFIYISIVYVLVTKRIKNHYKILFFLIVFPTIILSLIRSTIFNVSLIFLIYLMIRKSVKKSILYVTMLFVAALFLISIYPPLTDRFAQGFEDIAYLFNTSPRNWLPENNLSFRLALLFERLIYVTTDFSKILFGVGLIHENNIQQLFIIGLRDSITGKITQIESADVSWAISVLRYGIVGSVLLLISFLKYLKFFSKHLKTEYGIIGFLYIILSLLSSFITNQYAYGIYWMIPLLLINYLSHNNIRKEKLFLSNTK